ncbi:MAG TPA: hypothetical protein PK388_07620 [Kiritimatiellia bacterium]|nr:hypothetical protein [Kiritimatiellia bacterium]
MKTSPPPEPLVQKSFGAPLPDDVRQAMRRQLATARAEWQAEAEKPRGIFVRHSGISWLAAAAGLLILTFGGARWMQARHSGAAARTGPETSYICVTASFPEKSGTCTAVFYSKDDPARWTERRMALLGADGTISTVISQNPERSPI